MAKTLGYTVEVKHPDGVIVRFPTLLQAQRHIAKHGGKIDKA